MNDQRLLSHVTGTIVKSDPEYRTYVNKKTGDEAAMVKFSVGVQLSFGENGIMQFLSCVVFNDQLVAKLVTHDTDGNPVALFKKGQPVAMVGNITSKQVGDKTYYDMNVIRIGAVEWLSRGEYVPQPSVPATLGADWD